MADKLNLSVETVKTHRKNIAHKAGTKGKAEFRLLLRRLEQEAVL
ncbi:LuxR C-terminal-related transcriptional regulator [Spirosoma montaniterrae]|nr:LuxR C-terminal-related transcriptional regulator [Spirosoma montaniterrae]